MKILIAGGAGYVGTKLSSRLHQRGYDVSVIDLFLFGNELDEGISYSERDIFNLTEQDLKGFDQVIFLAGLSNDPMAEYSPSQNFIWNAAAPAYLAYISKRAGVKRYIYASSCSVYGYTEDKLYDENAPTTVQFPYGVSKLQGEKAVMHLADENFSVISLRKGTVCGHSPRMRLDLVVNTMFKYAVKDKQITINNPSIWRPILDINDAVNAYVRSVEASESISGIFNISSGNYTVGAIADEVRDSLYELDDDLRNNIMFNIKHMVDFRNYKVCTSKAERVLSFRPVGTIKSIVQELYRNYSKFSDLDNAKYMNIEVFKCLKSQ